MVVRAQLLHFLMNSNFKFITQDQYDLLCKKCKNILNTKSSTLIFVAIPWMHPIREHPIFLERYKGLFFKKQIFSTLYLNLKCKIKNYLIWIRQIYRSFYSINSYWYTNDTIQAEVDCLFISHILNSSQLKSIDDFYFSNIPSDLINRNYSVLIGYINNLNFSDRNIQKSINITPYSKVYFSTTLNYLEELSIRKLLRKESRKLKSNSNLNSDEFTKNIYNYASKIIYNGETQAMLRLYEQVRSLVRKCNPKTIISLYEGHAYERILMAAARSINPNIVCISYQHTGTFRLSNAIKQQLHPQYNPDVIFTSGIECKELLSKLDIFVNTHIEVLGSIRGLDSIIRKKSKITDQFNCLVIPEGIIAECLLLFRFSLDCALLNPKINFIWRLHPGVSFGDLKSREKKFITLPSNILLSEQSLESDIELCNWVLYRGTTAIFKAISYGLRPFYLRIKCELTIDPLFNLNEWRIIIDNPLTFLEIVNKDIKSNFNTFSYNHDLAIQLCEQRFSKLNIDVLDKYLKMKLDFSARSNLN
jgi:hypothetical protein